MHYNRINFKIAVTGILLSLALLFQYLSNFMFIVPGLMSINMSLAFIVPIFFIADYKFGMIAIFTKFLIGIFMNPSSFGGLPVEAVGQSILLLAGLIYIHLILLFKKMKLSNKKHAIISQTIFIVLTSSVIMTLLNGILFVPLYMLILGAPGFEFSLGQTISWGLSSYWAIVWSVYMVGNIVNYTIASIVLILVFKTIKPITKSKISDKINQV